MRARVNSTPKEERNVKRRPQLLLRRWRLGVPFFSFSVSYSIFESLNSLSFFCTHFFSFSLSPMPKKHITFPFFGKQHNRFSRATREPPPPPPPSPPSPSNNTRRKRVFNFFLRTTTTSCRRGQNDTTLAEENRRKSSSTRMNSRLEWNASSSEIISRTFRE